MFSGCLTSLLSAVRLYDNVCKFDIRRRQLDFIFNSKFKPYYQLRIVVSKYQHTACPVVPSVSVEPRGRLLQLTVCSQALQAQAEAMAGLSYNCSYYTQWCYGVTVLTGKLVAV